MKRFLLICIAAIITSSCGVTRYSQTTYLADFRAYAEDGFTVTPSSSGFIYKSVGDISMDFKIGKKDGYNNSDAEFGMNHIFVPTYDYMTAEMVGKAKSLGADALLNYRVTPIYGVSKFGSSVVGYNASGFAAKLINNK